MQPEDFLKEAIDTVAQRGIDNGYDAGQERSAEKIAQVFNALTGHELTEADVWTLLICLKLVRNRRAYKRDNIVDAAGYLSLLGECLHNEHDAVFKKAEAAGKTLEKAGVITEAERVRMLTNVMLNAPKVDGEEKQGRPRATIEDILALHAELLCMKEGEALETWCARAGFGRTNPAEIDSRLRMRTINEVAKTKNMGLPILALATGAYLDAWGEVLRIMRNYDNGTETDKAYRDRLMECVGQMQTEK